VHPSRLSTTVPSDRPCTSAGVTGGGCDEQVVERRLADDAPVGDAVEAHATDDAQTPVTGALAQLPGQVQDRPFQFGLHRGGEVAAAAPTSGRCRRPSPNR
jgi:hypothetical protein